MVEPTNYTKFLISFKKMNYIEALEIISGDSLLFSALPQEMIKEFQEKLFPKEKGENIYKKPLEEELKQGTPLAVKEFFSENDYELHSPKGLYIKDKIIAI